MHPDRDADRPKTFALAVPLLTLAAVTIGAWAVWTRVPLPGFNALGDLPPEVGLFRDDAYYEFGWARSMAAGLGPVVGASDPTSGIQLLWSLALVPFSGSPRIAWGLGLLIHILTAWLVAGSARRGGSWLRAAWGIAYLSCPFLLTEAQNGQETALAGLLAVVAVRTVERGGLPFATVCVVATLARTDLWLLCAGIAVTRQLPDGAQRTRAMLSTAAGPLLAVAAHGVANLTLTGRFGQDSAWPIPWLFYDAFIANEPDLGAWIRRIWFYLRPVGFGWPFALGGAVVGTLLAAAARSATAPTRYVLAATAAPTLVVLARLVGVDQLTTFFWAAGGIVLGLRLDRPTASAPHTTRGTRTAIGVLVGFIAVVALHFVVRTYPRDYYFAPLTAAAVVALARSAIPTRVALALVLAGHAATLGTPPRERPWQEEMAMAGQNLERVLSTYEPVGSFNAGLIAWYAPHPVHNLDGVVNHSAFDALRRGELRAYCRSRGITCLLDAPTQFQGLHPTWPHTNGRHFGARFDMRRDLVELARFDVLGADAGHEGMQDVRLYRFADGRPATASPAEHFEKLDDETWLWTVRTGDVLEWGPDRVPYPTPGAGVLVVLRVRSDRCPVWLGGVRRDKE